MRVPSDDQHGCVSFSVVSLVSGIVRPPAMGRMRIRIRKELPAAYATCRPSGEIAGCTSHHVVRLDIAVDDAVGVGVGERVDYFHEEAHRVAHLQLTLPREALPQ